jgi:hypothetical protein
MVLYDINSAEGVTGKKMKALSIQEFVELRNQSRDRFGVELHLHDQCSSQYLSTDGKTIEKEYLIFLTGFLDDKNLSALISDDRTGVLIIPKGI